MDKNTEQRLLDFLTTNIDVNGALHLLAVSAVEIKTSNTKTLLYKVRVAVTFREDDSINPYFDGTDMYIEFGTDTIQFFREDEWADGPPIMEGSPVELALPWVSELAPPFHVSPEALDVEKRGKTTTPVTGVDSSPTLPAVSADDFDNWF